MSPTLLSASVQGLFSGSHVHGQEPREAAGAWEPKETPQPPWGVRADPSEEDTGSHLYEENRPLCLKYKNVDKDRYMPNPLPKGGHCLL